MVLNSESMSHRHDLDYISGIDEKDVQFLPKIPAQPIGYEEARIILQ